MGFEGNRGRLKGEEESWRKLRNTHYIHRITKNKIESHHYIHVIELIEIDTWIDYKRDRNRRDFGASIRLVR